MNPGNANDTLIAEIVQLPVREKEKAVPAILAKIYDQAMIAEREAHLGADSYERAEERDGYANGFKPRSLQARVGRLSLRVPQVRGSTTRFYPKCLERGARNERALDMAVEKYAKDQSKLSAWMQDNIPEGLTVFAFPEHLRKKLRTNNVEERFNRSIKARTRLVGVFPNQASQLRLVSAICMEIGGEWEPGTVYLNAREL